jgi:hypothetical protein
MTSLAIVLILLLLGCAPRYAVDVLPLPPLPHREVRVLP